MVSEFINNLRLEEMAPGEKENSWGTITNKNLELIAKALGIGTLSMALDADTTFTMPNADASGEGDELRSLYLVINATTALTDTRVVTIAPDIISKTWIIKNNTTQTLRIKQGIGAGTAVDILASTAKIVVTDGAGPPANVIEVDVTGAGLQNIVDMDGGVDINGKGPITTVKYSTNGTPYATLTSNVTGALSIIANAGDDTTAAGAALRLRVGNNGTSNLIIDSAGDVTIGGDPLDLGGTKNLSIVGNASGGGAAVVLVSPTETVEDAKNKYISSIGGSFVIGRLDEDATGAVNQLVINNDGNVTIGIFPPLSITDRGRTLRVDSPTGGTLVLTDTNAITTTEPTRNKYISSKDGSLVLGRSEISGASPIDQFIIDNTGNAGIGGDPLAIPNAGKTLRIADDGGGALVLTDSNAGTVDVRNKFITSESGSLIFGRLDETGTAATNQLTINNSGSISADGNAQFGGTLVVDGNVQFDGTLVVDGNVGVGDDPLAIATIGRTLRVVSTTGGALVLTDSNSSTTTEPTRNKYIASKDGSLVLGRSEISGTSPIDQFVIDNDGNVSIGLGGNLTVQATTGSSPTGGIINGRGVNAGSYTVGSPGATEIGSIYIQESATIKDTFTLSATNGLRVYGSNGGLQPPTYITASDRDAIDPVRAGEIINIGGILWVNLNGTAGAGNWAEILTSASPPTVPSPVVAWVNIDGSTTAPELIIDEFNVASVVRVGDQGKYTITFTTPISEKSICIANAHISPNPVGSDFVYPWVGVNMVSSNTAVVTVVGILPDYAYIGPTDFTNLDLSVSFIGKP